MRGPNRLQTMDSGVAVLREEFPDRLIELAYHAAVPVAFDPGFIHLLRLNFFDTPEARLSYEDEADFLLSPICRPFGDDLFDIEPSLRDFLQSGLKSRFGPQRPARVAELLLAYTARHPEWQANPPFKHAQELSAWLITDPDTALAAFRAAAADHAREHRLPADWYVAMGTRIERRLDPADGFQVIVGLAREGLAGDEADGAAATRLLGNLARMPGGDRVPGIRPRPGPPPPPEPVLPLAEAARHLDVDSLPISESAQERLRTVLLPGAFSAVARRALVEIAGTEPFPVGVVTYDDVWRAVDRLAHLGSGASDRVVHRVLAEAGERLATQFDLCEASAAADRARRSFVIVVLQPSARPGRYRASVSLQRGAERPMVYTSSPDCGPEELAGMVGRAARGAADIGFGPTIEFALPDELLTEPVDEWLSALAKTHAVVIRRLSHAQPASDPREDEEQWRRLDREGHLLGVAVPLLTGPDVAERLRVLRSPVALWSREPRSLQPVVDRYGPARLPDSVRLERAIGTGKGLALLWDDPFRPLSGFSSGSR
ncbi:hypothetical protein ACQP00_40970 [Dactylosporangium sp. CS-047395]|uniref:VMAP-C domain-containing protein n=1 Tax=Dactylosporangium sp. CS-047395 TaxID=3239936 RepID=UPI003D8E5BC6